MDQQNAQPRPVIRRVVTETIKQGQRVDRLSFMDKRHSIQGAQTILEREQEASTASALESLVTRNDRADFEVDEAQQQAIDMVLQNQYAIIAGYAGTGKTTTMAKILPKIEKQVAKIDFISYASFGKHTSNAFRPAIGLFCYTNVAARNLASKLPDEWGKHCMSVHAGLAFAPEAFDEYGELIENGRNRFEPRYTSARPLPLDAVFIDEAGIIPKDLWDMLIAACRPDTRIYFLGDLAQLPSITGASPMPFAFAKWPHVVLDKIYRQKEGGALLDGITQIRRGIMPSHDPKFFRCAEKEILPSAASKAQRHIEGYINSMYKLNIWDPAQDVIITPVNDGTLGRSIWNSRFRYEFNPERRDITGKVLNPVVLIKCATTVVTFQVGDKVMATTSGGRLATERRFVNGAIGTVTRIEPNPKYKGDLEGLGERTILDMDADEDAASGAMAEMTTEDLEEITQRSNFVRALSETDDLAAREASHIITVVEQATGEEYRLTRSAELESLRHAYAVTAHKFQGSQARNVLVICHDTMPFGHQREWLYTACSRARERVFLLHTPRALQKSVESQAIVGRNPLEKMQSLMQRYQARQWAVPKLPNARPLTASDYHNG